MGYSYFLEKLLFIIFYLLSYSLVYYVAVNGGESLFVLCSCY